MRRELVSRDRRVRLREGVRDAGGEQKREERGEYEKFCLRISPGSCGAE